MNEKKLNKLSKKYIEVVTKDFDKPFDKKDKLKSQDGGAINDKMETQENNVISIKDILKLKNVK